ncbi:hypothetical protein A2344_01670 [Candidatus Peregrinibacteria bacterium RIFOXYB12_FULL_41_12]|nr:MAG: hypothetical protein A2344_01670 [Candidatus Peregrinibacteria bacterium RIFOXYB12_FULL_41_12]
MKKILICLFGLVCLSIPFKAEAGELPYGEYYSGSGEISDDAENLYADHFEAAYSMKEWGIFDGYEDGTFGPSNEINRAELAKVLVLATGVTDEEVEDFVTDYDLQNGTDDYFSDLDMNAWYVSYIRYAQIKGWVSGYPDGTYKPSDSTLLCEALKMILESQYGTPSSEYAGDNWYDVYVNPLLDLNVFYTEDGDSKVLDFYESFYSYSSENLYYTFNSDIAGKIADAVTRQDVAELLYRIHIMLELGDGELSYYDLLMTIDEYQETYGATIEEVEDGVLTIDDPYFGFHIENVYIKDFDLSDLKIYIHNPSGFINGWYTKFDLMYPTIVSERSTTDYSEDNHHELFELTFVDPSLEDIIGDSYTPLYANCISHYRAPIDLWNIYSVMCGQVGENSDQLESLLNLNGDGDLELDFELGDFEMSVTQYNNIANSLYDMIDEPFSDYHYYSESVDKIISYLDYADELLSYLQSEDADQVEAFRSFFNEYKDNIAYYAALRDEGNEELDDAYNAAWFMYQDLNDLIEEYEEKIFSDMSDTDTFVIELPVSECIESDSGYVVCGDEIGGWGIGMIYSTSDDYRIISGDTWDYFDSGAFSIFVIEGSEEDIGLLENNTSDKWIRITVKSKAVSSLDWDYLYLGDSENALSHFFKWADGYYYGNDYCNEILSIEWVE